MVIAWFHLQHIHVFYYLDDSLHLTDSPVVLEAHMKIVLQTLLKFEWLINGHKSQLILAQKMEYLNLPFDTANGRGFLPSSKIVEVMSLTKFMMTAIIMVGRC